MTAADLLAKGMQRAARRQQVQSEEDVIHYSIAHVDYYPEC